MNRLNTLSQALAAHARLNPDKLAARDSGRSLSFAQLHQRSESLARGLRGLGLQKGDRVVLLAYNCLEWIEIYAALACAGLVAVPVNFRLTAPEIAYIAQHSEARAWIVQDSLAAGVEPLCHTFGLPANAWICFGSLVPAGWVAYEQLIHDAPSALPPVLVNPGDISALMYTSGTTGRPKGVVRSHEGSTLMALATALEMGFTPADTALLVMPMCHANSLYFSHTFLHLGATCVIDDRRSFDPEALLSTLAKEHVTFTSLVPTHYIMMLGLPEAVKCRFDVSAVEKLMISSAPARKETKLAIMDYFSNGKLYELYGSTEAGWVTLLRPQEQLTRLGSVGREWMGSGPIRLLDEQGNEVPDGAVGELYSHTPYVFEGYWKNPEKTAEAFRGNWCSVGDMGRRDTDGYIHLIDRKSNMIISGGENIYPSEVEAVLSEHPKIKEVAVIGLPDDKWGEAVHAWVVLHQGQLLTQADLIAWCRERIAGYKRPQAIHFIDDAEMPRTATGKILHRQLREQAARPTA